MQKKILNDAIEKFGNISQVHLFLVRAGLNISASTLNRFFNGKTRDLPFEAVEALVDDLYQGDWNKAKKKKRGE